VAALAFGADRRPGQLLAVWLVVWLFPTVIQARLLLAAMMMWW
jgi:hypothetical protein